MKIRHATINDRDAIVQLYKLVATKEGGISRSADEVTDTYVNEFMVNALTHGIILVADDPYNNDRVIAEIHSYLTPIYSLEHTFGHLTVIVHPDFQGTGIGRRIFGTLLKEISEKKHKIARVELVVRESNSIAISLYKTLGFKEEGRFEKRIMGGNGLEADIPMAWLNPNYKEL